MAQTKPQKFVEWILDNVFDSMALGVAAYMFIRHQIKPFTLENVPDLATGLLGVLGLLAISGVWDRNRRLSRIERFAREGRDLVERRLNEKARAGDFFSSESERQIPSDVFSSATRILISGISLTRTAREYMFTLGQRLVAGATVRVMIVDPGSEQVLAELALRSVGDTTSEYWRNRLDTVVTIVQAIAKTPGSKGTLSIGFLPYIPSFGLILVDSNESHGFGFAEIYHHKSIEPTPFFEFQKSEDPYWFDYFSRQAEILWNSCRVEELSRAVEVVAGK
jgi:hypothetical protein